MARKIIQMDGRDQERVALPEYSIHPRKIRQRHRKYAVRRQQLLCLAPPLDGVQRVFKYLTHHDRAERPIVFEVFEARLPEDAPGDPFGGTLGARVEIDHHRTKPLAVKLVAEHPRPRTDVEG